MWAVPSDSMFNRVYVDSSGNRHHYIELLVAVGEPHIHMGRAAATAIGGAFSRGAQVTVCCWSP